MNIITELNDYVLCLFCINAAVLGTVEDRNEVENILSAQISLRYLNRSTENLSTNIYFGMNLFSQCILAFQNSLKNLSSPKIPLKKSRNSLPIQQPPYFFRKNKQKQKSNLII